MRKFFDGLADFTGKTGASFRAYLDQEHARAREAARIARANQIQQMLAIGVQQYYATFAEMLCEAILSTAAATHISEPRRKEDLFSSQRVQYTHYGFSVFIFRGFCNRSSLDKYCMTLASIELILQEGLDTTTELYGFPRLKVFLQLRANGIILFRVAFLEDIKNAIKRNSNVARK